jgi:small-conductance mechanosensitive channel
VEAIGLKSTRIRSLTGEQIIVSNSNLLSKELRNFARVEYRRITQVLGLVYHTPTEKLAALPEQLRAVVDGIERCNFLRAGLDMFSPSSVDVQLVYDIHAEDQDELLAHKNDVNIAVLNLFAAEGLGFAYPTQTTYTAAPDGTLVMPYAQPLP